MADLAITATQVLKSTGAVIQNVTAGATVTAGQTVYKDVSVGTYKLAQCDGTSEEATCAGIALHAATSGQPLQIQSGGTIIIGAAASVVEGMVYTLSDTAGGIAPHTDADDPISTEYATVLGVGDGSSGIVMSINNSGQQVA